MVTVTPEISRMMVLSAGRPNAGMISKVPLSRGPSFAGPLVGQAFSNSRVQQLVADDLGALAAQPRHRQRTRVEQRAEERGEEHHLGEDEPHHSHAERAVDIQAVHALLVLTDDGAEPADEHEHHQREARQHRPGRQPSR